MGTSGPLRIVTSYDLGTLGPGESEPILYHWRWYYSVPGLALWVVLALAMVVPKANRTREVLLILVPVLLVNLVWLAAALILKPVTSDQETFGVMVQSLAMGSAVLWLLGDGLTHCTPCEAIVLALSLALAVAFVGAVSVTDLTQQTIALPSLLGLLMPAIVLGYAGAGWTSRRTYRSTRFILLLGAWIVAISAVVALLWYSLESAVTGHWPARIIPSLAGFLLIGAILGACDFLISLPFVLVGLRSPLFRPRLFTCLRLRPGSPPADNGAVADIHEEG